MQTKTYAGFLERKQRTAGLTGRPVADAEINPLLYLWQRQIVMWAVRTGRAAIWADTGLGKTLVQLEVARLAGDRALVLAPLAGDPAPGRRAAGRAVAWLGPAGDPR